MNFLNATDLLVEEIPDRYASAIERVDVQGNELLVKTTLQAQVPCKLPVRVCIPCEGASAEPVVLIDGTNNLSFDLEDGYWQAHAIVYDLPPISVEIIFRLSPTVEPRDLNIICSWMTDDDVNMVTEHLHNLFESGKPVLATWFSWLEASLLDFLNYNDRLITINYDGVQDLKILNCDIDCSGAANSIGFDDEACGMVYACEICMTATLEEIELFTLPDCGHMFCKDCLTQFCKIHVQEGTVQNLLCLYPECNTQLPESVIVSVLTEEEIERFDTFLDARMKDAYAWCPMCESPAVYMDDESERLAKCTECNYRFCTECNEKWRDNHACLSEDDYADDQKSFYYQERKRKISTGTKVGKKPFIPGEKPPKERTPRPERILVESEKNIRKMYKKCPGCRFYCDRISGCDMMHCIVCNTSFCWNCSKAIKDYNHFGECKVIWQKQNTPYRERPEALVKLELALETDKSLIQNVRHCPICQQPNMKKDRNNHLRCWSCRTNYCFLCGEKIHGVVTKHFANNNQWGCKQHS